jgi:hypothetical protein
MTATALPPYSASIIKGPTNPRKGSEGGLPLLSGGVPYLRLDGLLELWSI